VAMKELNIPEPFKMEQVELLQEGIYDDPQINVYINMQKDFAFLYPRPVVDYKEYLPRVKKLNLQKYKKQRSVYMERYLKIRSFINNISNLLEIGAGDGSFLRIINENYPAVDLSAVEPDISTLSQREDIENLENYENLEEICKYNNKYDVICLFHVLEHIIDPSTYLSIIGQSLIKNDSLVIIEVPSLFDPLLSVYGCESYKKFYFQSQHPYIYSNTSIVRLMERNGFKTKEVINYQRYGIENHLNWLANNSPGGSQLFRNIFNKTNKSYITELEDSGKTDTVIWIGKLN
jgi:2-polyprenyl-3-methyl-5-hydroxy-6-metoxy-1,4-benzoquinol methylase